MFNLTLSSWFGSTGKLILHTYCKSMLWSIDSCQNRVTADQYHLTVSRAQVSTHQGWVFFEVIRSQVTSFQMIAGSSSFFFNSNEIRSRNQEPIGSWWNMLRLCAAQSKFWIQTDLGFGNSGSYYRQGRHLLLTSRHGHTLVYALIGQNLTGEFMSKIYAASWNLFTLTAEAYRVLCHLVIF